jgi:hypothetical protein
MVNVPGSVDGLWSVGNGCNRHPKNKKQKN